MKWGDTKTKIVTPKDPEANGLAEKFMKALPPAEVLFNKPFKTRLSEHPELAF